MKNSETTNDTDYWLKQFDEKKANPHLTAEPEVKVYSEYDGSSGPTNSATATNSIARKPVPGMFDLLIPRHLNRQMNKSSWGFSLP